jgi:3-deoxy-7-phosphoheptulonate synthase
MHGNTVKSSTGIKTRHFDRILAEVLCFFAVHKAEGSHCRRRPLRAHRQDVTECVARPGDHRELSRAATIPIAIRASTQASPRTGLLLAEMLKKSGTSCATGRRGS